jgi:nucleoside-diphosphate-sugar epimerase
MTAIYKNKKKILIVGGCGYIGGYLTDLLKTKEEIFDITVYDNLFYEARFLKDVNFIYGDIRDTKKLGSIINDYDIVIWLAALVGDPACQVDINLTQQLNMDTVKWLVDNYKGKVVFTSTCSVYGVNNDLIAEDAEPNPLSSYASTKLEAEKYILAHTKDSLIFRLGTLYGIGDCHSRIRLDLVVNILTKKAVEGGKLTVFGGEQWRPLLHVRDVSHAISYCLTNNITGLYNLSSGNFTISDIANSIKKIVPSAEVEYHTMGFEDLRNYRVKDDKIKDKGWKPLFNLEKGIKDMVKMFREKRIKDVNDIIYSNGAFVKKMYGGK